MLPEFETKTVFNHSIPVRVRLMSRVASDYAQRAAAKTPCLTSNTNLITA